jgi:hypothetical protein
MNRIPPAHITLVQTPLSHHWDNTVDEEMLFFQMDMAHQIAKMSDRAALAFSLGALEWILWRLYPEEKMFLFLDAAWAALVDWRYLKSFDLPDWDEDFDWEVGGPLGRCFEVLHASFVEARGAKPFIHNPVIISKVALHVCEQSAAFEEWQDLIIKRLIIMAPMNLAEPIGRPMPRCLLKPDYIPSPEADNKFIADYLAGLDWRTNPFLCTI